MILSEDIKTLEFRFWFSRLLQVDNQMEAVNGCFY